MPIFSLLKPAEGKLLTCCQSVEVAVIGEKRPTEKTEANEVRAEFLRWLILTKDIEINLNGIQVLGAWISGDLNLDNTQCLSELALYDCVFEYILFLRRAITKSIFADGSLLKQGMQADGLICQGDLHLCNSFESIEELRLIGARIEGNFSCTNATFKALTEEHYALGCEQINVCGNVSLSDGFYAEGKVSFLNAKIEGNFDCENAIFQSFNPTLGTLYCDGMYISGGVLFRNNCQILTGIIDLTNATVGSLVDDENFWKQETFKVRLDGLKYGHIHGNTSASFRLKNMLGKMPKDEFTPHPYKQLAKVLRDMGHDRDADEVMIALHDKKLEMSKESKWYKAFRKLYKWTSAYGYRPIRTLKIMASVWLLFGCVYWYGANVAVFAPSNPLVFQKDYNCTIDKNGSKWLASPKDYNESNNWYIASPAEYTTFQPFWYSLDIILPVVDLKMENDWGIVIPSPEGNWSDMIPFTTTNHFIRFLTWLESLTGWGLSLMLVAILSGLAKNEKE